MMHLSDAGLSLIKQFEGFSATPYLCPAQRWTIGYGHVLAPHEIDCLKRLTLEEADAMLRFDARVAERAVAHLITVPVLQHQFDALVCFTFNLGSGVLQRSTLRRVINRGEESAVAKQWLRFVWGGGRKLPGLAQRRAEELALYQG